MSATGLPNAGPLAGVKVLELGTLIAGPFAARFMGEFCADVIKIEDPNGGDPLRKWRKFYPEGGRHVAVVGGAGAQQEVISRPTKARTSSGASRKKSISSSKIFGPGYSKSSGSAMTRFVSTIPASARSPNRWAACGISPGYLELPPHIAFPSAIRSRRCTALSAC